MLDTAGNASKAGNFSQTSGGAGVVGAYATMQLGDVGSRPCAGCTCRSVGAELGPVKGSMPQKHNRILLTIVQALWSSPQSAPNVYAAFAGTCFGLSCF